MAPNYGEMLRIKCEFSIAFFGALRCGELAALTFDDISVVPRVGLRVNIEKRKNDRLFFSNSDFFFFLFRIFFVSD